MSEKTVFVEFVDAAVIESSIANFPVVANTGKPFELGKTAADAYVAHGVLKYAAKPKAEPKDKETK